MAHSFFFLFFMRWLIVLTINVLSIPFVTSIVIGTDYSGPIDPDLNSEAIEPVNPDIEPIDFNRLSTKISSDISSGLPAIKNDFTATNSDCSSDFIQSTNLFQRRQVSSLGSSCSDYGQSEPFYQEEQEISPSILISSAQKQSLRMNQSIDPIEMDDGGEGGGGGEAPIPQGGSPELGAPGSVGPSTGAGEQSENLNEGTLGPANNIVDLRWCPRKRYQHRQTPVCDFGKDEYIIRGVQDFELLNSRLPVRGRYNHVECFSYPENIDPDLRFAKASAEIYEY